MIMLTEERLHRSGSILVGFRRGAGEAVSSSEAEAYAASVHNWFDLTDVYSRECLLDLVEMVVGDADAGRDLPWEALVECVQNAFLEGELTARIYTEAFPTYRAEEKVEEHRAAPERQKTSWVAIRLVDDRGTPVPYKRYRIETPEGQTREGILDDQGRARVDGIEPGTCKVSFPGLDSRMWRKR